MAETSGENMGHPLDDIIGKQKTQADKALLAAIALLSTQHTTSEYRSFSHLTKEEVFDKLALQWDELSSKK
jgi:hypothetical protein